MIKSVIGIKESRRGNGDGEAPRNPEETRASGEGSVAQVE